MRLCTLLFAAALFFFSRTLPPMTCADIIVHPLEVISYAAPICHYQRQPDLVPRSKSPTIPIAGNHNLVQLTDTLDWTEMEDQAQQIRSSKLKNAAGRPPHLRALLGAMLLMAIRRLTYREAEDLIRYYAPARYLCGLTETQWTPDYTTIQDFTELMGERGSNSSISTWCRGR